MSTAAPHATESAGPWTATVVRALSWLSRWLDVYSAAAVRIARFGVVAGTVLAAVLIGLSDGIISVFFSPTLAKILATLLVALVLVFRPQGLFGHRAP